MSFQYVPSQFRIPKAPGCGEMQGFWCGLGADAGRFAFYLSEWGGHVMTDGEFCWSLVVDGSELRPVYSSVNGYVYWEGNGYVYYTQTYGWVWCSQFPGYEPLEERTYDEKTGETKYDGDSFYQIWSVPTRENQEYEMTPRGKLYGKEEKKIKAVWKRWTSQNEFGKYEPQGGASGDRYLGLPRWRGNGTYYVRSFAKENGHYTYGSIRFSGDKWVIGQVGSDSGWWEGSEPSKESAVTFKFTAREGSEAKGSDISVSFVDYVKGDETAKVMLGGVAIWR